MHLIFPLRAWVDVLLGSLLFLIPSAGAEQSHQPSSTQKLIEDDLRIYETTYSRPREIDPVIFNFAPNDTRNSSRLWATQLQGRFYIHQDALAQDNPLPLVVMLPGRARDCREMIDIPGFGPYPWDYAVLDDDGKCPANNTPMESHRGYDYLGRELARQGYAAISIDPLTVNVHRDPWPIEHDKFWTMARARLILRTLELFQAFSQDPNQSQEVIGIDIGNKIDFNRIGLMGHSRGGAGVRAAYNLLMTPDKVVFPQYYNWTAHLNASIRAVFEVAPIDDGEQTPPLAVEGAPWALLAAGCESDVSDYSALRVVSRQSFRNQAPNYFLSAYGANHDYFNTEWHLAENDCLGDQASTWDIFAPTAEIVDQDNKTHTVPLVLGSSKQTAVLSWAMHRFMKAHVKEAESNSLVESLTASHGRTLINIAGVEVGLANPNLATSKVLHWMNSTKDLPQGKHTYRTLREHAEAEFPGFVDQVSKFGYPPGILEEYMTRPSDLKLRPKNGYSSVEGAEEEEGLVMILTPDTMETSLQARISTASLMTDVQAKFDDTRCEVHLDMARRSSCYLPNSKDVIARQQCVMPREIQVTISWDDVPVGKQVFKSRFNVEFGHGSRQYDYPDHMTELTLTPLSWETVVVPCPTGPGHDGHHNLQIHISGYTTNGDRNQLEYEQEHEHRRHGYGYQRIVKDEKQQQQQPMAQEQWKSFLYLGPIREVWR